MVKDGAPDALGITFVEVRHAGEMLRHGIFAGLVAGAVLMGEEVVATVLLGGAPSEPFRLITSAFYGLQTLEPTFPLWMALVIGLAVHFALAVAFGVFFIWIVAFFYQLSARFPLLLLYGVLFGLALWELNVLTILLLILPDLAPRFGLADQVWNGIVAYGLAYGLVLGAYIAVVRPGVVGDWRHR
ncbi:MAG: hypothetical protein IT305_27555 [Chloroflexi bacterium]|nr:hypothetical protein [Chloroflexota bacterium]